MVHIFADRFVVARYRLGPACLLALILGCAGEGTAPAPVPASKKVAGPKSTYPVAGVVRAVDPASNGVTIKHDEIPGYMPAMTMPFSVKDVALLDDVRPGDKVEGVLEVEDDRSYLSALEVTVPATPALTLKLGDGGAVLKPTTKKLEVGQPVPDFTMTTQEGKSLSLADLRGNVVVLTFIYTRCPLPNFCPAMDRRFSALATTVGAIPGRAEKVRLLSVSFDPEHDTPDVLAKHAKLQGAQPPLWTFAVATHQELAKVAAPLGLMYGPTKDEIIHNLTTAVIGPDGKLARLEIGGTANEWTAADMLKTLVPLLPATSSP